MSDISINSRIDICVADKDYDKCYDYIAKMQKEITDYIEKNFDCTSESYLE